MNREFLDDGDRKVMIVTMKIMVFMKNVNQVVIIMNDDDDNDHRVLLKISNVKMSWIKWPHNGGPGGAVEA